jgi:hypothetical protein
VKGSPLVDSGRAPVPIFSEFSPAAPQPSSISGDREPPAGRHSFKSQPTILLGMIAFFGRKK